MTTIKINVYRDGAEWFAARWINDEYDGCDSLGIDNSAPDDRAIEAATNMLLNVQGERTVTRVDDIDTMV